MAKLDNFPVPYDPSIEDIDTGLKLGSLKYVLPPWRKWIAQRASIPTVAGSSPAGGATKR